jgi:hypothetical protein
MSPAHSTTAEKLAHIRSPQACGRVQLVSTQLPSPVLGDVRRHDIR